MAEISELAGKALLVGKSDSTGPLVLEPIHIWSAIENDPELLLLYSDGLWCNRVPRMEYSGDSDIYGFLAGGLQIQDEAVGSLQLMTKNLVNALFENTVYFLDAKNPIILAQHILYAFQCRSYLGRFENPQGFYSLSEQRRTWMLISDKSLENLIQKMKLTNLNENSTDLNESVYHTDFTLCLPTSAFEFFFAEAVASLPFKGTRQSEKSRKIAQYILEDMLIRIFSWLKLLAKHISSDVITKDMVQTILVIRNISYLLNVPAWRRPYTMYA